MGDQDSESPKSVKTKNVPENSDGIGELKGLNDNSSKRVSGFDSSFDISGKSLDFPLLEGVEGGVEGLYMYKNVFNLIPKSIGALGKVKTLKFFGNEVNMFPIGELRNLVELESLQVKVSFPGMSGLDLEKLKNLKELELCKVPSRPSAFPLLRDIAGLKRLTKLSVCHFSIRYLPPEIACLTNLECLDLSFNKMRNLPVEITQLNSLLSLKVANNKLIEVPRGLSSMQRLQGLDFSNNRLTSLENLDLLSMYNLQRLNLQHNKLLRCCSIPSWVYCNLEGNFIDLSKDDLTSSSSEMDVLEGDDQETSENSQNGASITLSGHLCGSSPNHRCFRPRKSKRWKRQYYLQQRARQERLNSSRKGVASKHSELIDDSLVEGSSSIVADDTNDKELFTEEAGCKDSLASVVDEHIRLKEDRYVESSSCVAPDSIETCIDIQSCKTCDGSVSDAADVVGESTASEVSNSPPKSKRHLDGVIDNPKPCKTRRPTDHSELSCKYSMTSFCGIDDYLPDGFYDAGRDRPFMSLRCYEQNLHLDSREVILVDRQRDEMLDAIALRAQALIFHFKQIDGLFKDKDHVAVDNLQIASVLALLVSDHFGGSDRCNIVQRARKEVSGSNYSKPFVCTCPTGNDDTTNMVTKDIPNNIPNVLGDILFLDLCEKALRSIKARQNSIVVPIGSLQFGVCRHRALLMKYLCDRIEPRISCELVRGYLDFSPHAWNVIVVKRGESCVRMIVDACRPLDIREETDPEYFCRYVPLSRLNVPVVPDDSPGQSSSFPSLSGSGKIHKAPSSILVQCKLGSLDALAKARTLEVSKSSADEIKHFEFNCIGEVRVLGVLNSSCIVKYYGHQISSRWAPSSDGSSESRTLQSAILMEHIKGGSLKKYVDKLSNAGEKRLPVELSVFIARDVASALTELHSRHIIHRDIKSENILIDLDKKRADGTPTVKLCDFDMAIPLRSYLHTCCIAHTGIPPPDVCVGTPRWMAPEVFQAMNKRNIYGLGADIWSFGCVLLELLTLQLPYSESSELDIHNSLQAGKRPQLPEELEVMAASKAELEDLAKSCSGSDLDKKQSESHILRFLVSIYCWCTEKDPDDRPTAENLHNLLLTCANSSLPSQSQEDS
ncbi:hypothetical protein RND71_022770 [Anisodus tanguticus]|uniref:Protein kinase domain-containing protein n=1 Tax=Anisodus tanguticus TaxID=243964 RepID=A0AAE1VE47_9SOLA|nr:hypothetical protein RND71_022770 [Anisodus tanguticus]